MLFRQGMATLLLSMLCGHSFASVVITGTRLVYPEKTSEITVSLENKGELPILGQTWMDSGDMNSTPNNAIAPFVLTPPVFRMDANAVQSVRVRLVDSDLPKDKESVFYFNLLEVPTKSETPSTGSSLQMAFRSRIKVFYRPKALNGTAAEAIEHLQWTVLREGNGFVLQGYNPSDFYVSLSGIALVDGTQKFTSNADMIAPRERHNFALPTLKKLPSPHGKVEISAINDWGAYVSSTQPLTQ
ncbi:MULTISPECIES: fimbrial biogenesis chaperone [unclassified Pseudomonas]|uniref:fimbrial biogenesis chaperone n=1 Tax=unclassified Pseudomonas TaxID=196821 RepID=UPI00211466F2|nr:MULTISPECIES: fimbria/pilus periplasmic chaperone [unclassified Pseudomonas]